MTEQGQHIKERFPDRIHDLASLMKENPEFLELCEDYDACVNALRYWTKSQEPEAPARIVQYHNYALEIEQEIIQVMNSPKSV